MLDIKMFYLFLIMNKANKKLKMRMIKGNKKDFIGYGHKYRCYYYACYARYWKQEKKKKKRSLFSLIDIKCDLLS